jgi:hypothetical protein
MRHWQYKRWDLILYFITYFFLFSFLMRGFFSVGLCLENEFYFGRFCPAPAPRSHFHKFASSPCTMHRAVFWDWEERGEVGIIQQPITHEITQANASTMLGHFACVFFLKATDHPQDTRYEVILVVGCWLYLQGHWGIHNRSLVGVLYAYNGHLAIALV